MTEQEKIIDERAAQLEKIGFEIQVTEDSISYVKGDVRMIPILMMCASAKDWNDFISKHSSPEALLSELNKTKP